MFVQWHHYSFIKYDYGLLFQQVKIHPNTNPPSPPSYQTPLPQLSHHSLLSISSAERPYSYMAAMGGSNDSNCCERPPQGWKK